MQRKNYLLKRSGFAMIMAILVIVVISTIMALSLSLTSQTGKRTTDLYLYEQAVLYSKSAAELALLDIAINGCINNKIYTFNDSSNNPMYDANVTMLYVYREANCNEYIGGPNPTDYIQTDEQNGSVLMDITVTLHDQTIATEPIRYFRRTIQKL